MGSETKPDVQRHMRFPLSRAARVGLCIIPGEGEGAPLELYHPVAQVLLCRQIFFEVLGDSPIREKSLVHV